MIEYVKKVFQNYATFTGRANRPEYWWFFLFNILVGIGFNILSLMIPAIVYLNILYTLATIIPSIAVGVRRMHDVGKSGWFILIPIYNLILFCTEGDNGTNEYGPNPNNPTTEFDFEKQSL